MTTTGDMISRSVFYKSTLSLLILIAVVQAHAASVPNNFTIEGRLYDNAGAPLNSATMDFRLIVVDELHPTCVLYSESYTNIDVSSATPSSQGVFSLRLGSGTPIFPGPSRLSTLFETGVVLTGDICSFTTIDTAHRMVRIQVKENASGTWETLSPDTRITPVPAAMVAETAATLQGVNASGFIKVNTAGVSLSQTNVENVFSTTNYPILTALLGGSSPSYISATPISAVGFNGQRITNVATPAAGTDAVNQNYADGFVGGKTVDVTGVALGVGGGKTLVWDQAANKWIAQTLPGSITQIVAGSGLLGGTITSAGSISVDTGTSANQIVKLDGSARLPAIDGSQLTNIAAAVISVAGRTGVVTLNAADISGLGTAALKDYGTAAGNLVELSGSAKLPALDGSLLTNINTTSLQTRAVASTAPTAGQVLGWNITNSVWEPQTIPVTGISDLTGDITATGPGSAAATITNGAITSAKINASGYTTNLLLITDNTNPNLVTYANCSNGEILKYNVGNGWLCSADLGSSLPTASVDLNGQRMINLAAPAAANDAVNRSYADGSIGGKSALTTGVGPAYGNGFTLVWDQPGNQWVAQALTGSVTQIVVGAGLVGGTITTNGSISVDSGTTANKIVKLDSSARLPAVDGGLVTNINASKLLSRNVSALPPSDGEVLTWNATFLQWEPQSAVTNAFVNNGNSFGTTAVIGTDDSFALELKTNALSRMTITSTGRIGVGVNNPISTVHVAKATVPTGFFASDEYLHLGGAETNGNSLRLIGFGFNSISTYSPAYMGFWETTASGSTKGDLVFGTRSLTTDSQPSERLRIDSNGLVGIGTASPKAVLDIAATGTDSAIVVPRETTANRPLGNATNGMIRYNTTTAKFEGYEAGVWTNMIGGGGGSSLPVAASSPSAPGYAFVGNTNTGMYLNTLNTLGFATSGTARMTIDSSGKVGIGTVSPGNALDVSGDINIISGSTNGYLVNNVRILSRPTTSSVIVGPNTNAHAATTSNNTVAIGVGALNSLSGAAGNTAVGASAGYSVNNGTYNTLLGFSAGYSITSGGNNTVIGRSAASTLTTGSNNIAIGYNTQLSGAIAANELNIGNTIYGDILNKNIGIGVTTPSVALEVAGTILTTTGQIVSGISSGSTTINWALGNTATTSSSTGITFNDMRNGGHYTLIVTETGSTPIGFNPIVTGVDATTVTYKFSPLNTGRTTSTETVYKMVRVGNVVYVDWKSGY